MVEPDGDPPDAASMEKPPFSQASVSAAASAPLTDLLVALAAP